MGVIAIELVGVLFLLARELEAPDQGVAAAQLFDGALGHVVGGIEPAPSLLQAPGALQVTGLGHQQIHVRLHFCRHIRGALLRTDAAQGLQQRRDAVGLGLEVAALLVLQCRWTACQSHRVHHLPGRLVQ